MDIKEIGLKLKVMGATVNYCGIHNLIASLGGKEKIYYEFNGKCISSKEYSSVDFDNKLQVFIVGDNVNNKNKYGILKNNLDSMVDVIYDNIDIYENGIVSLKIDESTILLNNSIDEIIPDMYVSLQGIYENGEKSYIIMQNQSSESVIFEGKHNFFRKLYTDIKYVSIMLDNAIIGDDADGNTVFFDLKSEKRYVNPDIMYYPDFVTIKLYNEEYTFKKIKQIRKLNN